MANSNCFKQPKKFWSCIKSLRKNSTGISCLKTNGHMVTDNFNKAKVLNAQFQSVFTSKVFTTFPEKGPNLYSPIPDITITTNGIAQLLFGLDVHKAPGPDIIGLLMLEELHDIIAPILEAIFNASLKNYFGPQDWKFANVTPILKRETIINHTTTDQFCLLVLSLNYLSI